MSSLSLIRVSSDRFGTRGVLVWDGQVLCHTFELPWRDNLPEKSCIPPGEYAVIKSSSEKFAQSFYVKNVPFRSGILIHPGNSINDTRGCILPGLDCVRSGVLNSRQAMDRLYEFLPNDFILTVQ